MAAATSRIHSIPPADGSRADDVLEMAERTRVALDPWQVEVIEGGCTLNEGKWAALEVGVNVPRQNGKGVILELVELTSLFTWGSELVIHSAHEAITSRIHFDRLWALVERTPDLLKQVRRGRPSYSHGQEGFKLNDGREILFRTRTKVGGRGLSCDHLFLDEAMILPDAALAALFPALRARPDPQVWYTGSAVDQEVHEHGLVFTRLRERGRMGAPALAYFEWSLDYDTPEDVPEEVFSDEEAWAQATPAYGIRITREHFQRELEALPHRTFAVELLGVGDYPDPNATGEMPIPPDAWAECEAPDSKLQDPVCLAFDVSPGRRTALAAAGKNQDGDWHVEVIEKLPGTEWLPARLAELDLMHSPLQIVCDDLGPGRSLVAACEARGVRVRTLSAPEHAEACGRLVDAVAERSLKHVGSLDLWNAIRGAGTRPLGDRWAWSRKSSTVDISPLVAATLALWSAQAEITDDDEGPVIY